MRSRLKTLLAAAVGLVTTWIGWGTYVSRTTERVSSETLDRFDDLEIRRYPQTLLVETTAVDGGAAFRRLFRHITGANERSIRSTATDSIYRSSRNTADA